MPLVLREASLFTGWGGAAADGGQKILDESRRGGEKFWTRREGGAKNFRRVLGGAKNFRPSIFSESLGKIRGHVKNLLRK